MRQVSFVGKRSMAIYREVMRALGAVDLNENYEGIEMEAKRIAKPYLSWV